MSCVYSPGVSSSWRSPENFHSDSMTTDRAGMLIPSDRVSVANTTLTRPAANSSSTASLNTGTIPAWWAATPAARASRNSKNPRAERSSSAIQAVRMSANSRIRASSAGVVSRIPAEVTHRTLWSHPARLNTK
jgi:hypothetical protein